MLMKKSLVLSLLFFFFLSLSSFQLTFAFKNKQISTLNFLLLEEGRVTENPIENNNHQNHDPNCNEQHHNHPSTITNNKEEDENRQVNEAFPRWLLLRQITIIKKQVPEIRPQPQYHTSADKLLNKCSKFAGQYQVECLVSAVRTLEAELNTQTSHNERGYDNDLSSLMFRLHHALLHFGVCFALHPLFWSMTILFVMFFLYSLCACCSGKKDKSAKCKVTRSYDFMKPKQVNTEKTAPIEETSINQPSTTKGADLL